MSGLHNHYQKISLLALGILVLSLFSSAFISRPALAQGEKYTWENANIIVASGGNYKGSVRFQASKPYTPNKDNLPDFFIAKDSPHSDITGCLVNFIIRFNGKNASNATLVNVGPTTTFDCLASRTDKYTKSLSLANTAGATASAPITVTVRSLVDSSESFPGNSDTIQLKNADTGKLIANKKATKSYSATTQKGFTVDFPGVKTNINYEACSKALNQCVTQRIEDQGTTPSLLGELGKTITIARPPAAQSDGSCGIDGIGWIVCPLMNFLGRVNDSAYSFLNKLLTVRSALVTDPATTSAWAKFRDVANVMFIIATLVIIYSQITSAGISNYGVKKMLPRLVIAAILVNLSYIICAAAVDLSNIIGSSIYDFFKSSLVNSTNGAVPPSAWAQNIGLALAVGAAVILIVVVIIIAPMSLLALGMILMILIARQAFVLLLIVISPVAFVLYLLPNTESLFQKWRKAFVAVLMVFPIVAVVFGASTLASNVLMGIARDSNKSSVDTASIVAPDKSQSKSDDETLLSLVALGVLAVPLFAVPSLLKSSLAAAGTVGTRLSGLQDKANSRSKKALADSRLGEARSAFAARRTNRKVLRRVGEGRFGRINKAIDGSKFGKYIGGDKGAAQATSKFDADYEERTKDAATLLQASMSHDDILAAAESGQHNRKKLSEHERDAAIRYTMDRGNFHERRGVIKGIGSMTRSQRKSVASGLRSKGDTSVYGNTAVNDLEASGNQGTTGLDLAAVQARLEAGVVEKINAGEISAETVTKDHRVAKYVSDVAPGASAAGRTSLHDSIDKFATENPQAWTKLDKETRDRARLI